MIQQNELKKQQEALNTQLAQGMSVGFSLDEDKMQQLKKVNPTLYKTIRERQGNSDDNISKDTGEAVLLRDDKPRQQDGKRGSINETATDLPIPTKTASPDFVSKKNGKMKKRHRDEPQKMSYMDIKAAMIMLLIQLYRQTREPEYKKEIKDTIMELRQLYPDVSKMVDPSIAKMDKRMNYTDAMGLLLSKGYTKSQIQKMVGRR